MSTVNVVYERTKGDTPEWSASFRDGQAANGNGTIRQSGATPEKAVSALRADPRMAPYLNPVDASQPAQVQPVAGPFRVPVFVNKRDWLGPAMVLLSSWYFAAQIFVAWVFVPRYDFFTNAISDLGATSRSAAYPFHSPRWIWMDISIGVLGAAMALGSILIFTEFRFSGERRERIAALIGFVLLSLSGLGALMVACVPENLSGSEWHLHTVGTAFTIAAGQLGILILGLVLRSIPDWLREFMIVASLVVVLGGVSYVFGKGAKFGFGGGALERIIQYPQALWLILFGLYISREHFRKGVTGRGFTFTSDVPPAKGALRWALHPGR